MDFIKKLNINAKVSFIISLVAFILFSFIGILLYFTEKNKLTNDNIAFMESELVDYNRLIENQRIIDYQKAQTAINTFDYFFRKINVLKNDVENKISIETTNIQTFELKTVNISTWYLDEKKLYKNDLIVDKISAITNSYASIYQKTTDGYVAISSNLIDNQGERAINYLISTDSEISYAMENGETYIGTENIFKNQYLVAAKPVYTNGIISGMICIYYKDELINNVKKFFEGKTYYNQGFAFIIDEAGIYKIHPVLENESIKSTKLFEKISKNKTDAEVINTEYYWPEDKNGVLKYLHIAYNAEHKFFVGITYFDKDFSMSLSNLKINIIIVIFILILLITLMALLLIRNLTKKIIKIEKNITEISLGKISGNIKIIGTDEFAKVDKGINGMLQYLKDLDKLSTQIKNENFDLKYELASKNDIIGKTLLEIKDKLQTSKETEKKLRAGEIIKEWTNEGVSKFIDILRFNNENISTLSYAVISNLVKYLDAVQGGFFVLEEKILNMTASFAYNKQRIIENKISIDSGLLGRAIKEKQSILLSEIPDNYLNITSGLGESHPKFLIIVPLKFENNILGVIEIASLTEFEKYKIDFTEEICESVALSLSNLKINKRTELLLKNSQEQSRMMEDQKEEMERNIIQLQELKKETDKREVEMQNIFKAIDTTALVAEFDIYGKILTMNDKFLKAISQDRELIIGKYHKDITSINTDTDQYKFFWNDLSEGKSRSLIESININNKVTWLSQTYTPIKGKDNKVYKILNIAIDITENKTLEKELRSQVKEINRQEKEINKEKSNIQKQQKEIEEKDNKLDFLLNSIDFSFIRIEYGIQGLILSANSKFISYYGYGIDEIAGKNIQNIFTFDDLNKYNKVLEKLKRGLVVEELTKCITKNGETIKFKITLSPMKNEKNIVTKILMVGTEIK